MRLRPWEFEEYTLRELFNAYAGWQQEQENAEYRTRLICYYSGQHEAKKPEDLWQLPGEIIHRAKEAKVAVFRKLSKEEVENWRDCG